MNKETRGNMCKNKLVSKSPLPTKPSKLAGSPELLSLPLRPPPRRGSLPVSATGAPALSPSGPSRSTQWGAPSPGLLQVGETESGGEMPGAGWGGKVRGGSPRAPGSRRKSEKQRRAPSLRRTPWGGGRRGWERGEVARCPGRPACSCSSRKRQSGA